MDTKKIHENYFKYVQNELNHNNSNIDSYARLIQEEYQKLINGEITIEEFEANTPEIDEETPLNYMRNRIIEWYPN